MLNARDIDEIERLIDSRTNAAYTRLNSLQQLQSSAANNAQFNSETIGNPGAAPSSFIYQLILLTARFTGKFAIGWHLPFNSGTTADSITMAVKTVAWTTVNWAPIAATGKHTITGATGPTGPGPQTGGAINGGSLPGVYQCAVAGTTITDTTTGASPTTTTQVTQAYGTLTGLLTANGMQLEAGSIIVNPAGTTAIGSPVAIQFVVSATNTISMTGSAAFWAYEYPTA